jgi:hypothetical protein
VYALISFFAGFGIQPKAYTKNQRQQYVCDGELSVADGRLQDHYLK